MKPLILVLLTICLFSCKQNPDKNLETVIAVTSEEQQIARGKELFEGAGNCFACHKPDQKIIGPSLVEIATIYKDQNADIVAFLREKSAPIVDPSQYSVMKTNFVITKEMSDADLQAIESFIYSNLKLTENP